MLPNQVRDWTPRGPNIAFFIYFFAVFKGPEGRVREIQDAAQGVSGGVMEAPERLPEAPRERPGRGLLRASNLRFPINFSTVLPPRGLPGGSG